MDPLFDVSAQTQFVDLSKIGQCKSNRLVLASKFYKCESTLILAVYEYFSRFLITITF